MPKKLCKLCNFSPTTENLLWLLLRGQTVTSGPRCYRGDKCGTNCTKFTTFNPERQSRFSFPLLTRTSATFLPSSYQQSIWFEQQAVTQIKRGSCLCSSCGRPLCGGCDLTRGSCWPPFCVGPVMSPGFVLGLWVGPPHYWNAPVGNWKRRMKGSQQRC